MNIPQFKNKKLLEQVFTHRSYLNEAGYKIESNERLEFLGDSILSFVVSSHIFNKYKNLKEGELTSLRSVLTNTETLYRVAKELNLGKQLHLSRGEEASGGREGKTILADTLEALIGGLYLDQGVDAACRFIEDIILNHIDKIAKIEGLKDPKSKLQELGQEKYKITPNYKIMKEVGPDHAKVYTVAVFFENKMLATGTGRSKQEAEKNAAKAALEKFKLGSF